MKIIESGHLYELESFDGGQSQRIQFITKFRGAQNCGGTINQELLRVLIDRVFVLNKEKPWELNAEIIRCLRRALVLHEARALIRKVEKNEIEVESIKFSEVDGHFII